MSDTGPGTLRDDNLTKLVDGHFDVFIVGGGINGAVAAASLSARGLDVGLAEKGDFASSTSQESSNLVWGGFKYLQNYELPLVFKLSRSRNQLLKAYPTNIREVPFLATLDDTAPFPSWLAGLGALAYWGIGAFATDRPHYHRPAKVEQLEPVVDTSKASAGLEYADAYLLENDARFVWSFARKALDLGATVANYVSVVGATRDADQNLWVVELRDELSGRLFSATAQTVINAAGPYVDGLNQQFEVSTEHRIVYSKGIHLVVPKVTDSERVLTFFDDTQRLFYVIPMAQRSVIGTTDTRTPEVNEPVTDEDRQFLLDQINARLDLDTPLTTDDIIAERCGVRPLVVKNDGRDDHESVDWTSLSRKHEIEVDTDRQLITIFGGKITDCLNVGEEMVGALNEAGLSVGDANVSWFGEPPIPEREAFYSRAKAVGLDVPPAIERADSLAEVLWRRHGLRANEVIDAIEADETLGQHVLEDSDILKAELALFKRDEMIVHPDDFLRRRTKLSLVFSEDELQADPGIGDINELFPAAATS